MSKTVSTLAILNDYISATLVFVIVLSFNTWAAIFIGMFFIGAIQHRLGILGHEGAHHLLYGKGRLNDFITRLLLMYPLNMNLSGYREFHWNHHRFVGTDKDPEKIHTKNPYLAQWNLPFRPLMVTIQLCGDLIGGAIPHIAMAGYLTRTKQRKEYVGILILSLLTSSLFIYFGLAIVPILWYASLGTTFWFWFRLRMWTEHITKMDEDPTIRLGLKPWQEALFYFIFPYNTYMHWEHHKHPNVPWYNLPSVRTMYNEPKILTITELYRHHTKEYYV